MNLAPCARSEHVVINRAESLFTDSYPALVERRAAAGWAAAGDIQWEIQAGAARPGIRGGHRLHRSRQLRDEYPGRRGVRVPAAVGRPLGEP
jgi:hypothetical protein